MSSTYLPGKALFGWFRCVELVLDLNCAGQLLSRSRIGIRTQTFRGNQWLKLILCYGGQAKKIAFVKKKKCFEVCLVVQMMCVLA